MNTFLAAVEFEALKFRRARLVWTVTALLGLALPVLAAVFTVAATAGGSSKLGLKAAAILTGRGWSGYLGAVGMMQSVGALMGIGFVVCWSFGREFTEKTQAGLFALPVGRRQLAYAKFAVILAWSLAVCVAGLVMAAGSGAAIGLGLPGPEALAAAAQALAAGLLTALLACPLAVVASMARGYLPGVGGLVLLVVITQVVTTFGAGAWFPYAAPGLWMGMGGAAAAHINPWQLILCIPVSVVGMAATGQWWKAMEVTAG
ncbi:ABC transporter permease [Specibacter cremeus]|uniref:ABC transporter permease n=1 Tax=Specibacter cremeus TaxID=1629051 RepID=UPI000F7942E8|nr:ABC transporter permease [Specibacter cremeus]